MKKIKSRKLTANPPNSVDQHTFQSETTRSGHKAIPSALDRILKFAEVPDGSELYEAYLAVSGLGRPLDDLVASHNAEANKISAALRKALKRKTDDSSWEIGLQVQHFGSTPGSAAVLDIPAARKAAKLHKNAGVDAIAAIRIYPVEGGSDDCNFDIELDILTILFGSNARSAIARGNSKSRARASLGLVHSELKWLDPHDDDALKSACNQLMAPRLAGLPKSDHSAPLILCESWDTDEARGLRSFVSLMHLSMLPMKKKLIVSGEGKPIVTGAIADAEHRLSKACKGTPPIIHRDGVPHFWFSELRRLGLDDFSVPLVKLH